MLLGLDGPHVTDGYMLNHYDINMSELCPQLVCVVPSREDQEITQGDDVQLSWLKSVFYKKETGTIVSL